uniref:NSFL1 cofactor p47 n=1 Tax=Sipha flava TaxID=143950 RepID=A0A2S2Q2W9_9HEMI
MSESEQGNKVNEFVGITNVDTERAKFYLEMAAWNMDSALATFYDEGADDEPLSNNAVQAPSSRPAAISNRDAPVASASSYKPVPKPKKWQPQSRIMTFSSLRNSEVEDKDSDDEEGQRFYAGGSITSGQQVIGPPRNNADVITDMFQTAQKHATTAASSSSTAHESGASNFFGTGYKLGQTENDTEVIPSLNPTSKRSSHQEEVVLKIWKEGFTINDGELHSIDQPENREFLLLVARGEEIPPLLLKEANVSSEDELHVSVEDHRYEEYVPTKQKKKVFGGSGHLLGSPAPEVVENTVSKETSSDTGVTNEAAARAEVPLTPDAPTTTLQIRLVDGTRLIATFNHNHTIGDVHRYIRTYPFLKVN